MRRLRRSVTDDLAIPMIALAILAGASCGDSADSTRGEDGGPDSGAGSSTGGHDPSESLDAAVMDGSSADQDAADGRITDGAAADGAILDGGSADDATADGGGPLVCGGSECPSLSGYSSRCNAQDHCQYERTVESEPWHPLDVWVHVPGGSFPMGAGPTERAPDQARDTATPVRTVTFSYGFLVAKYEAVVAAYEACEASGICTPPSVADHDPTSTGLNRSTGDRSLHPQNGVTWDQARTFCAWLEGRLPSEAEWEFAVNGADVHRVFPWGDEPGATCARAVVNDAYASPCDAACTAGVGCATGGTFPVGARPNGVSARGLLDTVGNIAEWTEDCVHDDYVGAPTDGSAWSTACTSATGARFRGGAYHHGSPQTILTVAGHYRNSKTLRSAVMGVRCVRDP